MANCSLPRVSLTFTEAGQGEYFKFYYHGPQDNRERYYRVSFRKFPPKPHCRTAAGGSVGIDPVVVMETIMGGTPAAGASSNGPSIGGGKRQQQRQYWFKLLIKPGCDATEEEGEAR